MLLISTTKTTSKGNKMSSHHDWVNQTVKLHNATKPFAPENGRCLRFAVGDKVIYTNPAGLKFRFSITGHYGPANPCSLYAQGARYLVNSNSPWLPVMESQLQPDEGPLFSHRGRLRKWKIKHATRLAAWELSPLLP